VPVGPQSWSGSCGVNISGPDRSRGKCGSIVIKALRYKPEGRGFENRCNFFLIYLILLAALSHGIYLASNRNEYQKQKNNVSGDIWGVERGRCVELKT
jgi:hypothetical protein